MNAVKEKKEEVVLLLGGKTPASVSCLKFQATSFDLRVNEAEAKQVLLNAGVWDRDQVKKWVHEEQERKT